MEFNEHIFKENANSGSSVGVGIRTYSMSSIDTMFDIMKLYKKYNMEPHKKYIVTERTKVLVHGSISYALKNGIRISPFNRHTATLDHIKKYIKITEGIKGGIYDLLIITYCEYAKLTDTEDVIIELYNSKHIIDVSLIFTIYYGIFNYSGREKLYNTKKDKFSLRGIAKMFDIYEKYPFDLNDLSIPELKELYNHANKMRGKIIRCMQKIEE